MKKRFYEILGIAKGADAAAIKKAYRKKALSS
jgi:molecular chaperone DnaJ